MPLSIQTLTHNLSFSTSLTPPQIILFPELRRPTHLATAPVIRMGGGPRTYPGGVSKWQWKRMQAKKAKQLLKARLCRERQIYEMRKRAELRAAASELERPWEVVERAPALFSVSADEQLKVLADRFQRPGGFDMWTENDGPELFRTPDDLPSARFFPKGVVHSVKPYRRVSESEELGSGGELGLGLGSESEQFSNSESLDPRKGDRSKFGASDSNRSAWSDSEETFDELDVEDEDLGSSSSESLNSKNSYGLRKRGNGRKFGASRSSRSALSDLEGGFGILDLEGGNGGELGEDRRRNDKRSNERRFSGRLALSSENGGSLSSKNLYGLRGSGNRRSYGSSDSNGSSLSGSEKKIRGSVGEQRNGNNRRPHGRQWRGRTGSFSEGENENGESLGSKSLNLRNSFEQNNGRFRRKGNGRSFGSSSSKNGSGSFDSGRHGLDRNKSGMRSPNLQRSESRYSRGNGSRKVSNSQSEVYDMSLQQDGSYGFPSKNGR